MDNNNLKYIQFIYALFLVKNIVSDVTIFVIWYSE